MTELKKIILTATASSILTAVVFITNTSGPTPTPISIPSLPAVTNGTPSQQEATNELAQQLAIEKEARQALEYEVEWLQALLDESVASANNPPSQPTDTTARTTNAGHAKLWFDSNALRSLGIDETEIANIEEAFNKTEMDKLYLRNQAARQGGPRGRQFMREMRKIQQDLQQQLSTENYDRLLYASGQANRVEVTDTLAASPAETAGIQAGDVLISYAGERIFSPRGLFQATTQGETGEMVSIEILRNNERNTLYLPRGPMGTRFKPTLSKPENNH